MLSSQSNTINSIDSSWFTQQSTSKMCISECSRSSLSRIFVACLHVFFSCRYCGILMLPVGLVWRYKFFLIFSRAPLSSKWNLLEVSKRRKSCEKYFSQCWLIYQSSESSICDTCLCITSIDREECWIILKFFIKREESSIYLYKNLLCCDLRKCETA